MTYDQAYHSSRARIERELATRSVDPGVSDAHLRLSALHLSRASLIGEIERNHGSRSTAAVMPIQDWAKRRVVEI